MMKLNIDICTTRRVSGWIFNVDNSDPVQELYIEHLEKKIPIKLVERLDVANAFSLKQTMLGIEINIPDCFDGTVDDYKLYFRSQEIFSYRSQYEKLLEAETAPKPDINSSDSITYNSGRHVIFLHDNDDLRRNLEIFSIPIIKRSFPEQISGCTFSSKHIDKLTNFKSDLLSNLSQIIIVAPSALYTKINKSSPTLIESGRFITIYSNGDLHSPTGLHEHQLNHFILHKTHKEDSLPPFKSSIARIWSAIENYADLLFQTNSNLFFAIRHKGEPCPKANRYISNKIQQKRREDIVRVRSTNFEIILLNICAYPRLFDKISEKDCWQTAIRRGLKHLDLVI